MQNPCFHFAFRRALQLSKKFGLGMLGNGNAGLLDVPISTDSLRNLRDRNGDGVISRR
jgi:hypothetical protein